MLGEVYSTANNLDIEYELDGKSIDDKQSRNVKITKLNQLKLNLNIYLNDSVDNIPLSLCWANMS